MGRRLSSSLPPERRTRRTLGLVLFGVVCLVAATGIFLQARFADRQRLERDFRLAAQNRLQTLERAHAEQLSRLKALAAYDQASSELSPTGFATFIERFTPRDSAPLLLGWAPAHHREGLLFPQPWKIAADGSRVSTDKHQRQLPLALVFHDDPDYSLYGYDLAAEPLLEDAVGRALAGEEVVLSPLFPLPPHEIPQRGHVALYPVFCSDEVKPPYSENCLQGFFVAFFPLAELVDNALKFTDQVGIDLYVFDRNLPRDRQRVLYRPSRTWEQISPPVASIDKLQQGLHHSREVNLGGGRILIVMVPAEEFIDAHISLRPRLGLVVGCGLALWVFAYAFIGHRRYSLLHRVAREQAELKRQLEDEVNERRLAQQKLQAANRELEAFVYTVSHDLKTPLTAIIGYAEMLQMLSGKNLDDSSRECLVEIEAQGQRMAHLIRDLLDMARAGSVRPPDGPVSVEKVVQEVVESRAGELIEAGIRLDIQDLPDVEVAETLLYQVFDNLIGNAIRYGGRAGSELRISGQVQEGCWRYEVADQGSGIPEDEREQVFELFYRGTTGKQKSGTGIGLATVRKIAVLHDGEVKVTETPGGGSTFVVSFRPATKRQTMTGTGE